MKRLLMALVIVGLGTYLLSTRKGKVIKNVAVSYVTSPDYVDKERDSVFTRIRVPTGYARMEYPQGSYQQYLQQYALKPYGAKVINYDGSEYAYQAGHVGVLEVPVPDNGLQQCADALIRIRAEYLWDQNRRDEIGFNFTSGHYCSWKQYAKGYRPKINGSQVSFHQTAAANSSKENFYRYLNLIYTYSGTQSLYDELPVVNRIKDLEVGDMLIYPGSPGHVIQIVDMATDSKGEKLFIFAQGNTPAQSVHLLKNPNDNALSPWYELEMNTFLAIPTYYFESTAFIRFKEP